MKFKEKQILAGDIHVAYIDEGKSEGIPLIFIHGFPFNKWMWENQIDVFKEHVRVLAYDVRGFGNTNPGTLEYSIDQFGQDLFHFMDALQIEKAIVSGLSMGGYIALNAIEQQPERVSSLILADTQCLADSDEAKSKRLDTIATIQKKGLQEYTEGSIKKLFSENSLLNKKEEVLFIEHTIQSTRSETICNTLKALASRREMCPFLELITIPVLIMVGQNDQITTPEVAKKMHERIQGSILHVINHAGHLSNLENAGSFNLAVLRFLNPKYELYTQWLETRGKGVRLIQP
jgi:3-oxoadipate enol-lactonase